MALPKENSNLQNPILKISITVPYLLAVCGFASKNYFS